MFPDKYQCNIGANRAPADAPPERYAPHAPGNRTFEAVEMPGKLCENEKRTEVKNFLKSYIYAAI